MRGRLSFSMLLALLSLPGCLVTYSSERSEGPGDGGKKAEAARVAELEREVAALRDENDRLREVAQELRGLCEPYVGKGDWKRLELLVEIPEISTRIAAVDREHNVVILSAGTDERVRPGYEFTVYRGDEKRADYVAKVVVTRVDTDFCVGYCRKELQAKPPRVGDSARTRW
jgi:hypothetical protein